MQDSQRIWDPNTTPEDVIAQLSKMNDLGKGECVFDTAVQDLPDR